MNFIYKMNNGKVRPEIYYHFLLAIKLRELIDRMKAPCCECCTRSCMYQGPILLEDDCSICGDLGDIYSRNNASNSDGNRCGCSDNDKVKSQSEDNSDENGECEPNVCLYDVHIWLRILQNNEESDIFDDSSSVNSVDEINPAVIENPIEIPIEKAWWYNLSNVSIGGPLSASTPKASTSSYGNTKLYTLF